MMKKEAHEISPMLKYRLAWMAKILLATDIEIKDEGGMVLHFDVLDLHTGVIDDKGYPPEELKI